MIRADGYEELRKAIVSGELLPGERLLEEDLSARLGFGRAAVRMALVRLEHDGLVQRERHRGARVRRVSESEAVEILEARAALEGLAARHAAVNADDAASNGCARSSRRCAICASAGTCSASRMSTPGFTA